MHQQYLLVDNRLDVCVSAVEANITSGGKSPETSVQLALPTRLPVLNVVCQTPFDNAGAVDCLFLYFPSLVV